jgi:hypothetical protein
MNVYFANVNVHEFIGLFTEFIQIVQHNARKNLPTSLTFTIEVHTIYYKVNILIIVFVEAKYVHENIKHTNVKRGQR